MAAGQGDNRRVEAGRDRTSVPLWAFREASGDLKALTLQRNVHTGSRADLPLVVRNGADLDLIRRPDCAGFAVTQNNSLALLVRPLGRVPLTRLELLPGFVAPGMLDFDPRSQARLPSLGVHTGR